MKKKIRPIILALAVLGIGYMSWTKYQGTKFRYSGTLEAEETDISPGVVSQIDSVEVKEGDMVKAGQVLIKLQCQEVRINAANVTNDFNRAEKLFAAGSLPKASYDRSKYQAQNANLQISFCDITSPIDAAVVSIYRRKGEWARPGGNLLTLEDLAHPYAYIYVPLEMRAKVKLGAKVTGYLAGDESKPYPGVVSFFRPDAEFTPKNVQTKEQRDRLVFGVKIAFDNAAGALSPGLPIDVKLAD